MFIWQAAWYKDNFSHKVRQNLKKAQIERKTHNPRKLEILYWKRSHIGTLKRINFVTDS